MALNGYQGQIRAKDQQNEMFLANQELYPLMTTDVNVGVAYISRIGIQYKEHNHIHFEINGQQFEMGDSGIYEVSDIQLTSFKFLEDVDRDAIVDYIIQPLLVTTT